MMERLTPNRLLRRSAATLAAAYLATGATAVADDLSKLKDSYSKEVLPIFVNYCYDCHGDGVRKGELALDHYETIESMVADRDMWKRVRDHIDFRLMPPPDEVMPSEEERDKLLSWIDAAIFPVDPENPDPGHVVLRRLNRVEYQNTIRDLLGVSVNVQEVLPQDDSGYGFDNIADVLTLSPLHVERYLEAARTALDEAIELGPEKPFEANVRGRDLKGAGNQEREGRYLASNGEVGSDVQLRGKGRYRFVVSAGSTPAGDEDAKMELRVDGKAVKVWDVPNHRNSPQDYSFEMELEGNGRVPVGVAFLNDHFDEHAEDPGRRDRNLLVNRLRVVGPLDGPLAPKRETHRRIFHPREEGLSDEQYMTAVLSNMARKAFRRPVEDEEVKRYLVFLDHAKRHDGGVEEAVQMALEAMLVSPAFLFRDEPTQTATGDGKSRISEHALASRLSYFLWSSMPDGELFKLADEGRLREDLHGQVQRMLASPKSKALIENFVGQWLQLRDMDSVSPNRRVFGDFSRDLALDMRRETEGLIQHVIKEDLPIHTLLEADFTFLNERLAKHYGIEGVQGGEFRKVSLEGTPRRGLLGHGSILTLTSFPTRTSPVLRGKFILENILNTPPPPPPPNVDELEGDSRRGEQTTLRQRLEKHRDDPNCSSCHALMDPIGFGLENFDAVGRWRDEERGLPIDSSDKLVTGQKFSGAEELRNIIATDYRTTFHRAVATKMLTYALGRGLEWYDRPAVDEIVVKAQAGDARFSSWVIAVAEAIPFQYRRELAAN
jgi:hypothetical protein